MATIKYLLQSNSDNANIYVRFSIDKNTAPKRKTGYTINPKDWSTSKSLPNAKNEDLKILKLQLDKLATMIETSYNKDLSKGVVFDGEWLQEKINIFNNKTTKVELDFVNNYIQKYIDDSPNKKNQKNELGLSERRIKSLVSFKNLFTRFENETCKGKKVLIKEVNIPFSEKFINWLKTKNYSQNYIGKNIDNLKAICGDAQKNGFETSNQLKAIKSFSESKSPEDIIYLSESEQQKIRDTIFEQDYLNNAKKWLLLGCLIGQRGGDLLNINKSNIKEIKGGKIIEIRQQKTGKLVAIPLLPEAIKIIKDGFPRQISTTNFNSYIKVVCQKAEIKDIMTGREKTESNGATKIIKAPKFKLITTHVCRRSFATNFYGKIPTPILISITGHATEKMFLKYIGKTTYDHAFQMMEYFKNLNK